MNKRIILSAIVLLVSLSGFAQDANFVSTNQSLIYLNPSFAGSNGFIRNQFSYRNQWPNLSGSYVTYLNTFDTYIKPIKGGLALSAFADDQAHGLLITKALSLSYAQHLSLMDKKLKIIPSIQGSFRSKEIDRSRLMFGEYIDPRRGFAWNSSSQPTPSSRKNSFDISSGLLVNYNHFYFGTSVFHINQPDEGLLGASKLPCRFVFHSSYNWNVSENLMIHFFGQYQQQQKFSFVQFSANVLLYKHFIVGAGYIHDNVPTANIGFKHNYFTATLGYDVSMSLVSKKRMASSWEASLSFNLRNKENRKTITDFEKW